MQKSKIEWCTHTWNPVTGCFHGCNYCYAKKQCKRFMGYTSGGIMNLVQHREETAEIHNLDSPLWIARKKVLKAQLDKAPYPFGFDPTFHRYRLNEPSKLKKPANIFVCSMADLFGEWVPDEWIQKVFKACEAAPQHRYLFLTKNPQGLKYPFYDYFNHNLNWWIGTSITENKDIERANDLIQETSRKANIFLSIEPMFGEINLSRILKYPICKHWKAHGDPNIYGQYWWEKQSLFSANWSGFKWVIIGAETGQNKNKIIPKREWIEDIVNQCRAAGIPVFLKNSLKDIWGEKLIQEYPWEVAP